MKNLILILSLILLGHASLLAKSDDGASKKDNTDQLWGEQNSVKSDKGNSIEIQRFRDGNLAMLVTWGIYSEIANQVNGRVLYSISEWVMSPHLGNIPIDEYKAVAKRFNPEKFSAQELVSLAKNAGMKYIVVMPKHHDGFSMYDTQVDDFDIVDATPYGRDPMKEIAEECEKQGLGMGFYYSQTQDWTTPGGHRGPLQDEQGNPKGFEDYFYDKCLPQIEELCTGYGDIQLIWFDTPGNIAKELVDELITTVKKHQPNALISGRVGQDMGDYTSLGDMYVPDVNHEGLWEVIDTVNDTWGYTPYDNNWKTPKELVRRLVTTIARGGTYMCNVGPRGDGSIPEMAQASLLSLGDWVSNYPYVVNGTEASPWGYAQSWGDVVWKDDKMYLVITSWPANGQLVLHGLENEIKSARLMSDNGKGRKLKYNRDKGWTRFSLEALPSNEYASVVELVLDGTPKVNKTLVLNPEMSSEYNVQFAQIENGKIDRMRWAEKWGEWKTFYPVSKWTPTTTVSWDVVVEKPGYYQIDLNYLGKGRYVWRVESEEGEWLHNQMNSTHLFDYYTWGWMKFNKAGKHTITVSLVEGDKEAASFQSIRCTPIKLQNVPIN